MHSPAFLKLVTDTKKGIREVTIDQIASRLGKNSSFVLIDVREDQEWDKGRIANALHIGKGVLERDIESKMPDKTKEIILYCGGGFRSALAADALQKMGYVNVFSMDGGWRGWNEKGLPTEK